MAGCCSASDLRWRLTCCLWLPACPLPADADLVYSREINTDVLIGYMRLFTDAATDPYTATTTSALFTALKNLCGPASRCGRQRAHAPALPRHVRGCGEHASLTAPCLACLPCPAAAHRPRRWNSNTNLRAIPRTTTFMLSGRSSGSGLGNMYTVVRWGAAGG